MRTCTRYSPTRPRPLTVARLTFPLGDAPHDSLLKRTASGQQRAHAAHWQAEQRRRRAGPHLPREPSSFLLLVLVLESVSVIGQLDTLDRHSHDQLSQS